jgi:hypothetical protein
MSERSGVLQAIGDRDWIRTGSDHSASHSLGRPGWRCLPTRVKRLVEQPAMAAAVPGRRAAVAGERFVPLRCRYGCAATRARSWEVARPEGRAATPLRRDMLAASHLRRGSRRPAPRRTDLGSAPTTPGQSATTARSRSRSLARLERYPAPRSASRPQMGLTGTSGAAFRLPPKDTGGVRTAIAAGLVDALAAEEGAVSRRSAGVPAEAGATGGRRSSGAALGTENSAGTPGVSGSAIRRR